MIRLATLNLFNYLAPPGAFYDPHNIYTETQWQQKQAWLSRYIGRLEADIIGFQEVFSPEALQRQMSELGFPHFAAVQAPEVEDAFIHRRPPVALASRFPIDEVAPVVPCNHALAAMGLTGFTFSRSPLRARIRVPGFGPLLIYVVHLKSQRAELLGEEGEGAKDGRWPLWLAPKLSGWLAARQRTAEAALVVADRNRQDLDLPCVVMGDFNDGPDSEALSLFQAAKRAPLPLAAQGLSESVQRNLLQRLALQDAYALALRPMPRPYTHFWGPVGSTLDHLLLSCAFDPAYGQSLGQVDWVTTLDDHLLRNDAEGDKQCSDHAAVMAQISIRC
ncbi:endonuclease/exonuclease/phosphatase family protein [Ferrimonas gelatinilytica]|uniref:Endonuclease/exonuclease/phosphatase family protein n=1 Tax=Ferrimonas gelatinilytica TaxID=1255257 RepID=A0ABP9S171_9GAMM